MVGISIVASICGVAIFSSVRFALALLLTSDNKDNTFISLVNTFFKGKQKKLGGAETPPSFDYAATPSSIHSSYSQP